MTALRVAIALIPLLPALLGAWWLRRWRRPGRCPDRPAERLVVVWVLFVLAQAVLTLAWPGAPRWLWIALVLPVLAALGGLFTSRVPQRRQVIVARIRSCRER